MDYISEAERLKLYYKGLVEAGNASHIAAAYPDIVSNYEDPDSSPEERESLSLYLHTILPLYYKLAYIYNNRIIHEDLSLYDPTPQRLHTAEEIYASLQCFASYAVEEIIRTIGCSSATLTRLQQAFTAQDKDTFVHLIDTSDCDLRLVSSICEDIWQLHIYDANLPDEDLIARLDATASILHGEEHPISRSSQELSEAIEPYIDGRDEETFRRTSTRYDRDTFDMLCSIYRDNYDRFKPKERKQIEPLILKGGGYIDTAFCLPDDYFSFYNEAGDTKEFFGLHPEVVKAGVGAFMQLVNHLAEAGYIDASATTKQLFAYRFSGRLRPENVTPIEWHGKNGNSYELIYLVRNLTERANYRKMRTFFTGPKWVKDRDSSYARGADYHLKAYLHQLYPTLPDQL